MKNQIISYYTSIKKEAFWLLGIAIVNLILAFFAFVYWGEVGFGMLIVLSLFSIYQLTKATKTLFNKHYHAESKAIRFDQDPTLFVNTEKQKAIEENLVFEKIKNTFMVLFLLGILCLLMGAFGNWGDLSMGLGAAMALQSAFMLIFNLLSDFRNSFYQQKLKKYIP